MHNGKYRIWGNLDNLAAVEISEWNNPGCHVLSDQILLFQRSIGVKGETLQEYIMQFYQLLCHLHFFQLGPQF